MTITVIILTYNEEQHIKRCIESIKPWVNRVLVVDSGSKDNTQKIASSVGADVYQNIFINHAQQVNWTIDNCDINTDWVLRLDADEYLPINCAKELSSQVKDLPNEVTGVELPRKLIFLNRWIKYGSYYPTWILRLWRHQKAVCESRLMDEHMILTQGRSIKLALEIIDENLNSLSWWTEKHNAYSSKEAVESYFSRSSAKASSDYSNLGSFTRKKRFSKDKYERMPLFIRSILYFNYRYFLRFGFLDGVQGLIWHLLQALWYRFLVDAKVYELKLKTDGSPNSVLSYAQEKWGVKVE